jgi:methylenetetrahydrofolate dehydrogenase (NADP+)/methenyltetrahydrofolate cyclohydrolase
VIGRSNLVGKPMAQLLLRENCTVTIAHSHSCDLPYLVHQADILIVAVGQSNMIRGDWVKPGATVIDVGINRIFCSEKDKHKTRLIGDVNFVEVSKVASAITSVPGGVGLMTVACIMRNTVIATCLQHGLPVPNKL